MKRLLLTLPALLSLLMGAASPSVLAAETPWYGVHTVDSFQQKGCFVVNQIGLVRSPLAAFRGETDWNKHQQGLKDVTADIVKLTKDLGGNVVLGYRIVYQDTFNSSGVSNPHGLTAFSMGTAAVIKCSK